MRERSVAESRKPWWKPRCCRTWRSRAPAGASSRVAQPESSSASGHPRTSSCPSGSRGRKALRDAGAFARTVTRFFYAAFAWMTVLLVISAAAVIWLRSTASRILALDMLTLILVALLVLYADANRSPYYLDTALVLSLLAFVATLALSRYHGERRLF